MVDTPFSGFLCDLRCTLDMHSCPTQLDCVLDRGRRVQVLFHLLVHGHGEMHERNQDMVVDGARERK